VARRIIVVCSPRYLAIRHARWEQLHKRYRGQPVAAARRLDRYAVYILESPL
jgi:hypothetical protein